MCLFRKRIKKIDPKLNISSKELVVYNKLRKNRLYLGTQIKIPRNFAFILCSNKKPIDILYEGKVVVDAKTLPTATRRFSLYKVDKKGRGPKYFESETYFVNLNVFEDFKWETTEYAELEDRSYGEYKASCFGELTFKISNPITFLDFILKEASGTLTNNQATQILSKYINERVVRVLNKENPLAKKLYLKDKELVKLIYEKLAEALLDKGVDLFRISMTETRFPSKILNDLKSGTESPADIRGWGKTTFEEWQVENSSENTPKKPKFVTITPTGNNHPFFKESMAPYFFEDYEEDKQPSSSNESDEGVEKEPIWKGVDEKIIEKQSKKLVDLDDIN